MRARLSLLALALGALWLAVPAEAARVEVQGASLSVGDDVSVRNEIAVTAAGAGQVRVADTAGVIAIPPCVTESGTSVRCSGVSELFVSLGPLADELTVGEGVQFQSGSVLDGGSGADLIEGSDLGDDIFGFTGADVLSGDGGDDFQKGGQGNDRCKGGAGPDDCLGSDGRDLCVGGPGDDECDGGRGRDRCIGGPGADFGFGCELLLSMREPNF